jgi:type VI secretion system secreted protein Hcp
MAADMFMRVEGANGESKDANPEEWTHIKSFAWGAAWNIKENKEG